MRGREFKHRAAALLASIFVGTSLWGQSPIQDPKDSPQRPNIVLIISDDQDYEHFGFIGHPFAKTPAMDALAASGCVLHRAHLPMSRCRATLASMLSGLYPHQSGIYYNHGLKKLKGNNSLPMLLRDAGYATFGSGKFWEGDAGALGFTHSKGNTSAHFVRSDQEDALHFLDEVGGKKPFFMWWAPKLPHTPHNAPQRFLDLYQPKLFSIPPWIRGGDAFFRNMEHQLLASTSWLDEGIEELMEKLRSKKLTENTVVVFLIDNGWCNGLSSKGTAFEKGLQTPIIVSWPGHIPQGRHSNVLVSTLDLFPTLLSYAGINAPPEIPGRNLRGLIEGHKEEGRKFLSGVIYPAVSTIDDEAPERDAYAIYTRDDRWKYIRYLKDVRSKENDGFFRIKSLLADFPERKAGDEDLYDLDNDPYELKNLAHLAEHRERKQEMEQMAYQWWQDTGGKPFRSDPIRRSPTPERAKTKKKIAARKRPNIIYILGDDLGYGDLGCYGQKKIETPFLDDMAKEGMVFTQHYAGSGSGVPSRCALMLGLHPGHAPIRDNRLDPRKKHATLPANSKTIATLLAQVGYRTGMIGKWSLGGPGSTGTPNKQGFHYFYGHLGERESENHYPPALWRNARSIQILGNQSGRRTSFDDDLFLEEALNFIDRRRDGQPFFLHLSLNSPHAALEVPQDSLRKYQGKWDEKPYMGPRYRPQAQPRATYAAMVSRMDQGLGRILHHLKKMGIAQDTLVIFSSDNGPNWDGGGDALFFRSTGPFRGIKSTLFEGGIRVPMIAWWPGMIAPQSRSDHVSAFWDILPTLVDVAQIPEVKGLDGHTLTPTFLNEPAEQEAHQQLYWENGGRHQVVRFGNWKAHRRNPSRRISLFDLESDPQELHDLRLRHPEILWHVAKIMTSEHRESIDFPMVPTARVSQPRWATTPYIPRENLLPRGQWKWLPQHGDQVHTKRSGINAFDGDANTLWICESKNNDLRTNKDLVIDLGSDHTVNGIRYLARQKGKRGFVKEFELYLSDDGKEFEHLVLRDRFDRERNPQEKSFKAKSGRFVLLRVLDTYDDIPFAAIAEIGFTKPQGN